MIQIRTDAVDHADTDDRALRYRDSLVARHYRRRRQQQDTNGCKAEYRLDVFHKILLYEELFVFIFADSPDRLLAESRKRINANAVAGGFFSTRRYSRPSRVRVT